MKKKILRHLSDLNPCFDAQCFIDQRLEAGRSLGQIWYELTHGSDRKRDWATWFLRQISMKPKLACEICGADEICYSEYEVSGKSKLVAKHYPWSKVKSFLEKSLQH